jgi:hypothetical protein
MEFPTHILIIPEISQGQITGQNKLGAVYGPGDFTVFWNSFGTALE